MTVRSTDQLFEEYAEKIACIRAEVGKRVVGMQQELQNILTVLLAPGLNNHLLIEAVPGVGKTLQAKTVAEVCDVNFSRIQMYPDMRPNAIRGLEIPVPNTEPLRFDFRKGPIFANIVLADELNRTPPTTAAAVLEPMEELQVSTELCGTFILEPPFVVLATENPEEQDGVYDLSEAQKDRFMMRTGVSYPSQKETVKILEQDECKNVLLAPVGKVINGAEILEIRSFINRNVFVSGELKEKIVKLVEFTRPKMSAFADEEKARETAEGDIVVGGSTRVPIALQRSAKARAFFEGRKSVLPEDVMTLAYDVLNHRLIYKRDVHKADRPDILRKTLRDIFVRLFAGEYANVG
jgi:MoxR-like ATPase